METLIYLIDGLTPVLPFYLGWWARGLFVFSLNKDKEDAPAPPKKVD